MGRITRRMRVTRLRFHGEDVETDTRADVLAVEEPLEIRVGGRSLTTTMRTPGHDIELVHGFLFAEGIIRSREDIREVRYCPGATGPGGENTYNVLDVTLAEHVPPPGREHERHVTTTSACGVCGSTSIEQVMGRRVHPVQPIRLSAQTLGRLPEALRESQDVFSRTGGVHAVGLFTPEGETIEVREDVGRHNACDKVIGARVIDGAMPVRESVLVLSGRASFELLHKAVMAGIPAVVAVSAPSTLAVDIAREAGIILAGFTRPGRMNVYAGEAWLDT
ncbi:MAG: formate dehydrogenase accessory sulfurtransferase FdhD [Bowdeniella nasicola]|nr:formate dehydrogenase accessory sulfurtransferase FdhD [Bowdeniella nasicola]